MTINDQFRKKEPKTLGANNQFPKLYISGHSWRNIQKKNLTKITPSFRVVSVSNLFSFTKSPFFYRHHVDHVDLVLTRIEEVQSSRVRTQLHRVMKTENGDFSHFSLASKKLRNGRIPIFFGGQKNTHAFFLRDEHPRLTFSQNYITSCAFFHIFWGDSWLRSFFWILLASFEWLNLHCSNQGFGKIWDKKLPFIRFFFSASRPWKFEIVMCPVQVAKQKSSDK